MSDPYEGCLNFVVGKVEQGESSIYAAYRELQEETGLTVTNIEQLGAFARPDRDPRERVISIVYFTLTRVSDVVGADDAARARWFPINDVPPLAFDHRQIFELACERLAQLLKLKSSGTFISADFSYDEIDMIYYNALTYTPR
jgi:8-oxo-dGTP diphosphatase